MEPRPSPSPLPPSSRPSPGHLPSHLLACLSPPPATLGDLTTVHYGRSRLFFQGPLPHPCSSVAGAQVVHLSFPCLPVLVTLTTCQLDPSGPGLLGYRVTWPPLGRTLSRPPNRNLFAARPGLISLRSLMMSMSPCAPCAHRMRSWDRLWSG